MRNKLLPTTIDAIFAEEMARVRTEAQKAAWEFDDINDACPYPFASVAGQVFKEAFLTAQAVQRQGKRRAATGLKGSDEDGTTASV